MREGYEAVSMRKIAAGSISPPMALYRHFADKEALLRELCLEDFRTLRLAMDRIAVDPDPIERLRRMGTGLRRFRTRLSQPVPTPLHDPDPRATCTSNRSLTEHPEEDCYARLRDTLAEGLAAGRFKPGFDDVELLSQTFWAGLHGVVSLHIVLREADARLAAGPRIAGVVIDAFLYGLAAPGAGRESHPSLKMMKQIKKFNKKERPQFYNKSFGECVFIFPAIFDLRPSSSSADRFSLPFSSTRHPMAWPGDAC